MTEPEKFELALRFLGNEIFAFSISSESSRKNWIAIAIISVAVTLVLLNQLTPFIVTIASLLS